MSEALPAINGGFKAILADPPWDFQAWASPPYGKGRGADSHYSTMSAAEICAMPIADLSSKDCVLFLWACWPRLRESLAVLEAWGFKYKTCGFCWMKGNVSQLDLFREDGVPDMLLGYWTRSNSEFCLLGTRGTPKRLNADVRQGIIEPRREHSRKPDCVHERIERLVEGPYLELFARQSRPGWTTWGNEATKFDRPEAAA